MVRLSLSNKLNIINECEKGGKLTEVADNFNISPQAISKMKRKSDLIKQFGDDECFIGRKRLPNSNTHTELDQLVFTYFQKARSLKLPVDGPAIRNFGLLAAKRLNLNDFKASSGWTVRFLKRHGLSRKKIYGESGSVDLEKVDWFINQIPKLINGYDPNFVYNADETGLFYRKPANCTYTYKDDKVEGGKQAKNRVTLMLCTSQSGIKRVPLLIGPSKRPQSFKKILYDTKSLGINYDYSKKSWMTSCIFEKYLNDWDDELVAASEKIILFIDNATPHKIPENLRNIRIEFLPKNCTSKLQPMDAGIIANFKVNFKRCQNEMFIDQMEKENISEDDDYYIILSQLDLLDVAKLSVSAWSRVTVETIQNCWTHCGFKSN